MAIVTEPRSDLPSPPVEDADHGDDGDDGDGGRDRWWHSPWRLVVLGVALVFLGVGIGFAIQSRSSSSPGAGSVDVGFLQDMRYHHDQATQMSLAYLQKPAAAQDPALRTIAAEILLEQQLEAGAMVQLLHEYGQPEANESGIGMAWMSMPLPIAQMPGMATPDNIAALKAASGHDADVLFCTLMIAHHQGGLHMAEYAAGQAGKERVRQLATSMMKGQSDEIVELEQIQSRLTA
jgi:uncharacterized protein (DUF305 family)